MSSKSAINNIRPIDHFFRGAFSVDIVIFTFHAGRLKILLKEIEGESNKNEFGLLGKLILPNEEADDGLNQLLLTSIGFSDFYKKQLTSFSDIDRHPLGRVVTFAYYGLIPWERVQSCSFDNLRWCELDSVPNLIYDHNKILKAITKRFRKGLLRHPTVFELLPKEFILSEIIAIFEQAFNKIVDIPNFRKQILKSQLIIPLGRSKENVKLKGRPAALFSFDKAKYKQQKDSVKFNF